MKKEKPRNHAPAWGVGCLALAVAALSLQGCFLAALPLVTEVEGAGSDVAPTGAWDLFKSMVGGTDPMQRELTKLEVAARQQQVRTNAADKERSESERAATIGVLQDLWNWQHDPAIGDLLIYVKAGGEPSVAMRAAIQRTRWETRPPESCSGEPELKPVAQSSLVNRPRGTD